jgi:hypothetical protein
MRDWPDGLVFVKLAVTDPGHSKAAHLDEDPADGPQQFVLLASANEGQVAFVDRPQCPVQAGQRLIGPFALDAFRDGVGHEFKTSSTVRTFWASFHIFHSRYLVIGNAMPVFRRD